MMTHPSATNPLDAAAPHLMLPSRVGGRAPRATYNSSSQRASGEEASGTRHESVSHSGRSVSATAESHLDGQEPKLYPGMTNRAEEERRRRRSSALGTSISSPALGGAGVGPVLNSDYNNHNG